MYSCQWNDLCVVCAISFQDKLCFSGSDRNVFPPCVGGHDSCRDCVSGCELYDLCDSLTSGGKIDSPLDTKSTSTLPITATRKLLMASTFSGPVLLSQNIASNVPLSVSTCVRVSQFSLL